MPELEIHIDLDGRTRKVGLARTNKARGTETVVFEYATEWLEDADGFSLEPALPLTRGSFAPPAGQAIFGSIGDSAPDTWGRRLMQRAERRQAERERRAVRTLAESDYLLGVADETRLGALRFRWTGDGDLASNSKRSRRHARRNQPHGQRLRARRARARTQAMTTTPVGRD